MSHPSRVRGLKLIANLVSKLGLVASFTGAWIETSAIICAPQLGGVASFTGAWIETSTCFLVNITLSSHPSRVRGLKPSEQLG